ncbi:MAG TPA: magnesium-translocating P-type ATPase [Ilumatobacteraceae bacterium]|nr:magnesium-translocating P-type ATPase [Ilumatobacteraceae bacterium]
MDAIGRPGRRPGAQTSGRFWAASELELLGLLDASSTGLSSDEAARRLVALGPNRVGAERHAGDRALLVRQFSSPIVLLLISATVLSFFLGDDIDAAIILVIVLASAGLGFTQERAAVHAVRALQGSVQVHADVVRDGAARETPLEEVVPGDIVLLNAGDVVPGDCRLLEADALLVDESALTGESYPARKEPGIVGAEEPIAQRRNCVFLGTHIVSGSGTAVVAATAAATELGSIGAHLDHTEPPTSFERGLRSFGYLLMRVGAVLIVIVFGVNVLLNRPVLDSLLFSLALAVGITPQLLPAIVTLTLSRGARQMADVRVIVKRLSSIEDFGSMDTLCVDKTGTLTLGAVRLAAAVNVAGDPDSEVADHAWRNAHHQQGFTNPIDAAIIASGTTPTAPGRRIAELPYDFNRKRLSIAVELPDGPMMVTKGAYASIRGICTTAKLRDGSLVPIAQVDQQVDALFRDLAGRGFRVLAVATRSLPRAASTLTAEDEHELTLVGLLTFADPPKPGVGATIARLIAAGVTVRMITGDNRHAAAHIASAVGLETGLMISGEDLDRLSDDDLTEGLEQATVFAEVEPAHKERIIRALSRAGHSVGFLGDGINDATALRAADVGISVDTAVDVAKESAAIVLLDKDLDVLLEGIRRGRQSFANTLKYVFVTTSANFGNMVSMAGATVILPFLPLLPRQILLLNFVSDIPGTTIASDTVDPEQLDRPTHWNIRFIRNFMIVFGLISSVFDYLTFAVLRLGFHADAELFRTGWFLVSVATELLVMLVLRTRRPFLRSRPGNALLVSSALIATLTVTMPFTFAAGDLGFRSPSVSILVALAGVLAGYLVLTEIAKHFFYRFYRPPEPRSDPGDEQLDPRG